MATKFDIHSHVTNTIIAQIEAGTPPWRKPWTGTHQGAVFPERFNGDLYRGINVLMLWCASEAKGHMSSRWMTYKQAGELGGQVRKGEGSTTVVKFGTFVHENMQGEEEERRYTKAYRVFNADQIDGLPEGFYIQPDPARDLGTAGDADLDRFFDKVGAKIVTTQKPRAYYDMIRDHIHMPPIETFYQTGGYYGTLAHEVIHWTGSDTRLERFKKFNDRKAYAFEELVAEIGACFLGAMIGIKPEFDQSAAYIENWLQAMKEDKRIIFRAASEAQKAVDFVMVQAGREQQAAA